MQALKNVQTSKFDLLQERAIKNFASADAEFGRKIRELIDTKYSSKPASTSGAVQVIQRQIRCDDDESLLSDPSGADLTIAFSSSFFFSSN